MVAVRLLAAMRYLVGSIVIVLILLNGYIYFANRKATFKRKFFRWLVICQAVLILVVLPFAVQDMFLLLFVIPVIGWVVFGYLRFTKFCEWCGKTVRTNLPFTDPNRCPRCGGQIS